ncbi:hypothetical protein ACIQVK_18535 [Streptomyces sp. NPDC090493]
MLIGIAAFATRLVPLMAVTGYLKVFFELAGAASALAAVTPSGK